ncbi:MAG TPA: hypothetical protein PKC79_06460 [Solidesulfovibrio magneticus]|jgi:hypothetical protein|nr:hypothetical protein [Solidesulfovibrio magneticus]
MLVPLIEALLERLLRKEPAPVPCPVEHDDQRGRRSEKRKQID